jgi:N-acetylglucosaminyldiphosphoundecaprenol N-acetyl-beta-D-mannosaminyltransferase
VAGHDDAPRRLPTVDLMGVGFHALTEARVIAHILDSLDSARGGFVVTSNIDHLRRCIHDADYGAIVATADLVVGDGRPIVWASWLKGDPLPEVVAGSNLVSNLSAAAAARGRSVFLLGGVGGSELGAARILVERSPGLRIAGTHCPPLGFETDPAATAALAAALTASAPDIVYVGLGSPKQERLIRRLMPAFPGTWWLGVGISFSYLTGDVRRAPIWMRRAGLEWLHRLLSEPGRLARRYLLEGVPFALRLLLWSAWTRVASPRRSA